MSSSIFCKFTRKAINISSNTCILSNRQIASSQVINSEKKLHNNSKLKVDFYFDTISPYSWPAFEVLIRYRNIWNIDINYKPIFMGGLTTASGNQYLSTMAECPNKAAYQFMDLEKRTAKFFNIPFKMSSDPFNRIGVIGSLQQQRFITAVLKKDPSSLEKVIRNFWIRSWSEDLDVHTEEDIRIIAKNAGMSPENVNQCLESMKSEIVKQELKSVTDEAVDRGAFGSPTMFFTENDGENEQMFWGSDRFEMVADVFNKKWTGPDPR